MVTDTIKKNKKGYYLRRHFDGKHGVPISTYYFDFNDCQWRSGKLTTSCFVPTKELAVNLLKMQEDMYQMRVCLLMAAYRLVNSYGEKPTDSHWSDYPIMQKQMMPFYNCSIIENKYLEKVLEEASLTV